MNWSTVLIVKDEAKTLPKLLASLVPFRERGGEVCILDTGSTDDTVEIARKWGCKVEEVGKMYVHVIDKELADKINGRFIIEGELLAVKEGDCYFDFASARNHAASLASNDMVSFADADEEFTKLDLDKISALINQGITQFEYNFVFSHDQWGKRAISFVQSKFYDRRHMKWIGIVHESLEGVGNRHFLTEDVFLLEHWQNHETNRHSYLKGLAVDCFNNPDKDRNSHYFARELFWSGCPKSAIKEFKRHIEMKKWPAEAAQSMIFIGDAYGQLGNHEEQVSWYNKAFYHDNSRREALLKLARFYQQQNIPRAAAVYAAGALELPWSDFYANNNSHYTFEPHEILYWAKGWMGDIKGAQYHLLKALEYQPLNPLYLRDTKFYFDFYDRGIDGWMTFHEQLWLNETAKKMDSFLELGSWKGRSTFAIAAGCRGQVTCVDTWQGSNDADDQTSHLAKKEDVLEVFKKNTAELKNIVAVKKPSVEAAKDFADKSFDAVFVDATHTYEEVKADIQTWLPKAKKLICGHDYSDGWPGVKKAVNELFGAPDGVEGTIWFKYL